MLLCADIQVQFLVFCVLLVPLRRFFDRSRPTKLVLNRYSQPLAPTIYELYRRQNERSPPVTPRRDSFPMPEPDQLPQISGFTTRRSRHRRLSLRRTRQPSTPKVVKLNDPIHTYVLIQDGQAYLKNDRLHHHHII